ncbi:serine protease 27-like [Trachemys scripta elegans]|uniref:serine protease 27-like n=1 Tax=Trachemys scripta elegans TaxID=31138 RepID=UPI001552690A|nr:serine protease 27-like [Trachemys scripta elegans]
MLEARSPCKHPKTLEVLSQNTTCCYLMPFPGRGIMSGSEGRLRDTDEDFWEHLRDYVTDLVVLASRHVWPSPSTTRESPCSLFEAEVSSRIIGGQDAQEGRWPWTVSVQVNSRHVCGGSLVSTQWVVSAAHCFDLSVPYSQYRLVLGAHQLLNPSPNQVLAEVQNIIPHPSYNSKSSVADIALVRLKEPVATTKFIRPISLPGASRQFPVENTCWVTGWGDVGANSTYWKTQRGSWEADDSGNPLACQQGGTWYLAGVLSSFLSGITSDIICLEASYPAVFTRATAYDSWIQGHVNGVGPSTVASPAALILTTLLLTAL